MLNPETRAELLRQNMMKANGETRFLIARIEGTGQEMDPKKVLYSYFRYKKYTRGRTEYEKQWLNASLKEVWSEKFLGLAENFQSRPLDEVKKLEFQNAAYSAAYRLEGRNGDPRDFNKVFTAQLSGCTYACNYCYVPLAANSASLEYAKFFSAREIVKFFLKARASSEEPINVLRISGGEPTIVPEILPEIYSELEKVNSEKKFYLWIDTNFSTSKYMEKIESSLKDVLQKRNVGIVGCFKGVCKEDFARITGAAPEFYKSQFETAKLLANWKSDFYAYLPALVYENGIEEKLRSFAEMLRKINKNLPLRTEMLIIKEYPKAKENMEFFSRLGRPMPKTDQRLVFGLWHNKILPQLYPARELRKYCCEVEL